MFERFTRQARAVVVASRREARDLNHSYIGTEHLLLGLLAEASIASEVLRAAGVEPARVRGDVEQIIGPRSDVLGPDDAAALETIGIDLDAVLGRIESAWGPEALMPRERRPCRGLLRRRRSQPKPRFTRRSKKVLELSLPEALRLQHDHIGPEHILLGLLREGEGLAARVLVGAGVDLADMRRATITALTRAA